MKQPPITFIHLEYADGSYDDIQLRQRGECPLFNLKRKRPDAELCDLGAYTAGAMAGLLFQTAANTERIECISDDSKIKEILRIWFDQKKRE
jgi:hypothetical protein